MTRRGGEGRPSCKIWETLNPDVPHRYLWGLADARNRVPGVSTLLRKWGLHPPANDIMVRMLVGAGRIRFVKQGDRQTKIYEIADPDLYDPAAPSTQAHRPKTPAWG